MAKSTYFASLAQSSRDMADQFDALAKELDGNKPRVWKVLHGPISNYLTQQDPLDSNLPVGKRSNARDFMFYNEPNPSRIGANVIPPIVTASRVLSFSSGSINQGIHSQLRPWTGGKDKWYTDLDQEYRFTVRCRIHPNAATDIQMQKMILLTQFWGPSYEDHLARNPPFAILSWKGQWLIQSLWATGPTVEPFNSESKYLGVADTDWYLWEMYYKPSMVDGHCRVVRDGEIVYEREQEPTAIWSKATGRGPIPSYGSYSVGTQNVTVEYSEAIFEVRN